ncbi:xanthine dehydrogenase family protein molybdopterin-binding subunit [Streptomyces sp.]|uniref:xanthine dehydrogenase family protein molybdopterin-binding subunit n=1 Tax=Streptomyces sp. TaxID=1931 RepID=UPI0025D3B63D|nr:xanthine dehydrogenase family protein molybdopterin-binding subunit [Streptomyces sp.]
MTPTSDSLAADPTVSPAVDPAAPMAALPAPAPGRRVTGRDGTRADARAKVTGAAVYGTDIRRPGMLHAKVLRSPHPHARIRAVDTAAARRLNGVTAVLTGAGVRHLKPYGTLVKDQPVVAVDTVRHVGDIVAAVAAVDERTAFAALDLIRIDYEILPAVLDMEEALAPDAPQIFPDPPHGIVPRYGQGASGALRTGPNVAYEFRYRTGSAAVWDECDHVFTDTFRFSRMNHMHLEPFVTVAEATDEEIEVWTATQTPFPLRRELSWIFGLPENRIRVRVPLLGGGFGAKSGPKADPIAIRLSQLSGGRPVRFCMTTEEVFHTLSQHAATLVVTSGVKADGTFVARRSSVLLDGGAYTEASPVVCEKAGYRMHGAYRWRHVDSVCRAVITNTVPAGAFRGFGGTQATWAGERQIDLIAERLAIDPIELRRRNLVRRGEEVVPGELAMDCDLAEGLRLVADAIGYGRGRPAGRGVGIGIGVKDGGGLNKPAQARVKVSTDGDVFLHCGLIEMGQGGQSAMAQIVAEVLRCPRERITYAGIDTDHTPFDQGTNASSGITVTGRAVHRAADRLRHDVLNWAGEQLGRDPHGLELSDWTVVDDDGGRHPLPAMIMSTFGGRGYEFTADGFYKVRNSHLAPLGAPCVFWEVGVAGAEVEVDPETGRVTVLRLVVSGDAGTVINEIGCRGQAEGAAVFGLAQSLFEELRYEDGRPLNAEPLLYRVPLAEDVPHDFRSVIQEQGNGAGPFGAKGMGEGCILPIAPAIAQAIADAVGAQLTQLPMTPERVHRAIDRGRGRPSGGA